jgi:D-inositol-3-phosphate glycosyltransferase
MKNLKAAIIEPVGGHSGMDYYDFGLCGGLASANIETTLYTCDETLPPKDVDFSFKPLYKKIYGDDFVLQRGFRFVWSSFKIIRDINKQEIDLCHYHFFHIGPLELFGVLLAKISRKIIFITVHDVESFVGKLSSNYLTKVVYRLADHLIVHNKYSQDELIRVWQVPEKKTSIIFQGNQFHTLAPIPQDEAKAHLNIDASKKVLLFFGQIKEVKGLDILLMALRQIADIQPNILLVIAGRVWKDDFEKYANLISELKIEEQCICHIHFISNEDVGIYFSSTDLVVLPYKRIYQSAVILMGMSYAKPVVVSNLPSMTEMHTDKETGFLFKSEDPKSLAETILYALENPELTKSVGENGYKLMRDTYSWETIGRKTAETYQKVLAANPQFKKVKRK